MKLITTTPASLSKVAKRSSYIFVALVVLTAAIVSTQLLQPASADQYDEKIKALQADMSRYQEEADRLNNEATTLANALAQLSNEKSALQAQIDVSQAQYDQLTIQIAETEAEIKNNQDALGTTLADLYVDDEISTIEMLASSQSIGDFLNKQEYRNSVKDELSSTIKKVKTLKEQLTTQKEEVTQVLAEQTAAKESLTAKETEQSNLLAQTQNDESNYQSLIADSQTQIAAAKAAQAELAARASSSGGYTVVGSGTLSDYTALWAPNSCTMGGPGGWYSYGGADGDGGDGHGYGCRQCASYVAWRIAKETGKYYNWGNGGNFASAAIAAGYTNLGTSPQAGSIAVMHGNPGHVAWVEAVSGNQVLVSQYNWQIDGQYGMYSEMLVSSTVFDQYVKILN